jgi:hypothetical protein
MKKFIKQLVTGSLEQTLADISAIAATEGVIKLNQMGAHP